MAWFRRTLLALGAAGVAFGSVSVASAATLPVLHAGSKGPYVRQLQKQLQSDGYAPGPVDGVFGRQTLMAVKAFQKAHHLKVDGIVGSQTWHALTTDLARRGAKTQTGLTASQPRSPYTSTSTPKPAMPAIITGRIPGVSSNCRQLVVVSVPSSHSITASVTGYTRNGNVWVKTFQTVPAVVGKNGVTGHKREGDGKTPLGVYPILYAFGYDSQNRVTKMPYRTCTPEDFFVDDPTSPQYNEWVHGTPYAKSYERMRRSDGLYEYGLVLGYNPQRIPYLGSAIFIHVWRSPHSPTAGCVAMAKDRVISLLKWLQPQACPEVQICVGSVGP